MSLFAGSVVVGFECSVELRMKTVMVAFANFAWQLRLRAARLFLTISILVWTYAATTANPQKCVSILHDETSSTQTGPVHAVFLANLLGHWPHYEVRIRPIRTYQRGETEDCKATFYVGTSPDSQIPAPFLSDFFDTKNTVAWIGFGSNHLNVDRLQETFYHRVVGTVGIADRRSKAPSFFQHVLYKGSVFRKDAYAQNNAWDGAFEAVRFAATNDRAPETVLAELVHNTTSETIPYFLRKNNKFIIADVPFTYMHEGDRYFAFADLLFDILGEQPRRQELLAFARIEDIHALVDPALLKATLQVLREENVPVSIAHIPLFLDPLNSQGDGAKTKPVTAADVADSLKILREVVQDERNAIIWHGTTHQFAKKKNPYSGASGDDYEFWDAVQARPVKGDGVKFTLDRLAMGLSAFAAIGVKPRYWVTPHYQGSAVSNQVFGRVFPWVIGRVTYYPSSFGPSITLKSLDPSELAPMAPVDQVSLDRIGNQDFGRLDNRSADGLGQLFPFEIFRDVYGQRVIPETLGYISNYNDRANTICADGRKNPRRCAT